MSQLQWLNANCCYPVPIVSWCSLMTCDVMFPGVMIPWCLLPHVTTDVRTQDPSLPLSCLPAYSLATYWCQGRRCGVDWLLNVITRALSLMSAISRSASAQYLYFVWTIFCRLPLFMLPWSETTREVLLLKRQWNKNTQWLKTLLKSSMNQSLIVLTIMQPKCLCLGPGVYAHSVLRTSFISGAILPAVLYWQPHVPRSLHWTKVDDFS